MTAADVSEDLTHSHTGGPFCFPATQLCPLGPSLSCVGLEGRFFLQAFSVPLEGHTQQAPLAGPATCTELPPGAGDSLSAATTSCGLSWPPTQH